MDGERLYAAPCNDHIRRIAQHGPRAEEILGLFPPPSGILVTDVGAGMAAESGSEVEFHLDGNEVAGSSGELPLRADAALAGSEAVQHGLL